MGTTAEKLTYLNTTKQKIKDAINNIGGNITSETTFRQYVAALESIYQSMPKVSGTGTSLSLTPTLKGLMQIDLKGNTEQVQLSGKNKMYVNDIPLTSKNGVSYSCTDGVLTLNGTLTSGLLIDFDNFNLPAGTYIFNSWATNMTGSYARYFIDNDDSSNTRTNGGNPITLTSTHSCHFRFYANAGAVFTNAKVYAQIELGETRTDYEQYCGGVPSPNPSYPQDIHNVSGNNNIVVCGKNLFNGDTFSNPSKTHTSGGITSTISQNEISCSGTASSKSFDIGNSSNVFELKLRNNTKYTFSRTGNTTKRLYIRLYNYNKSQQQDVQIVANSSSTTFTTNFETYYCYLFVVGTTAQESVSMVFSVQIEAGETATTYEAYNGTTYPINLPVENLIPNTQTTQTISGITLTNNNDGTYSLSGTATAQAVFQINPLLTDLNVVNGETYTYSANKEIPTGLTTRLEMYNGTSWKRVFISDLNNTTQSRTATLNTTDANIIRQSIIVSKGTTINVENIGLMLEKGSKVNSFTPYGTTPIELNRIGTYEDNFLRNTGKNLFDYNTFETFTTTIQYVSLTLQPNTQYTMSSNIPVISGVGATLFFMKDGETASTGTNDVRPELSRTLTTDSTGIVKIGYRTGTGVSSNPKTDYWYQIEKGNQATEYEPYGNDKWYLHKEIGKYTFTGNESFSSVSEGYYMSFSGALSTSSRTIICNNYTNYLTYSPFVTSDYGISLLYSATQLYVRDKDISSASALKTKLANSGTYFYYILATATNTEITDTTLIEQLEAIYNAKSKNGTTNINQENNDLPFILDVSALLGSGS